MGQKLTGYVSRYIDGEYVNLRPGDDAPDWVTNPELLSDDGATAPSDPDGADGEKADDLESLNTDALKKIAAELGVAQTGKKAEIRERIVAKRAEVEADAKAAESDDTTKGRDELVARAAELGIEIEDQYTDAEIEALIEAAE